MKKMISIRRSNSMAVRIAIVISIIIFAVFTIMTAIIAVTTSKEIISLEKAQLTLLAETNAKTASECMQTMVDKQEILADSIKSMDAIASKEQLSKFERLIGTTQAENKGLLSLYFIAEKTQEYKKGVTVYSLDGTGKSVEGKTKMLATDIYSDIAQKKEMVICDPYMKSFNGKESLVLGVLIPIVDDKQNFIGVVGSEVDTALLSGADYKDGGYESFFNLIVCGHETVILNTLNEDAVGTKFADTTISKNPQAILNAANNSKPTAIDDELKDGTKNYRAIVPFYIGSSPTVWLSVTSVESGELMAPVYFQVGLITMIAIIAVVLLSLFIYRFVKRSLKPISELEAAAEEMAQGNLHVEIFYKGDNEIGHLADSMRSMVHTITGYINDIDRAMGEMSHGNFDLQPTDPFIGDFKRIETSITKMIMDMSSTLIQINDTSIQVSNGADQVSSGAQGLSDGSITQTSSVDKLSSAITEISEQVNKNAENAKEAKRQTEQTGIEVAESNERMESMMAAMSDIADKSAEISKIIKTIEDIAFQTNILALNAAVEAARAGSAGKGFAVVADEVRNLAGKSAEAASNTTQLIEETVQAVDRGTDIADHTAKSMLKVVGGTQSVTGLIVDIANASSEQAESIAEVTKEVEEISSVVLTNSATAQQSAAASEELFSHASLLKQLISTFKPKVVPISNTPPMPETMSAPKQSDHLNDPSVTRTYDKY